jgi:hypothetical protein
MRRSNRSCRCRSSDAVDTGAIDSAAQQQSQDATDITNAGIAETLQGINVP